MKSLLLVEDDRSLGITLQERLEKEGYLVHWAQTIQEATRMSQAMPHDLVILDVGLPDGSGFEFAQKLRRTSPTPFLFVTAQSGAPDRLQGFELGAEDFIPKPFHLKELLMRVRHVLERHGVQREFRCGQTVIDFERMTVTTPEGVEKLSVKDFQLLKLLISVSPRALSRDEILDTIWGEEKYPSTRSIDNSVVRLRQALADDGDRLIESVRGIGYRWIGQFDPQQE